MKLKNIRPIALAAICLAGALTVSCKSEKKTDEKADQPKVIGVTIKAATSTHSVTSLRFLHRSCLHTTTSRILVTENSFYL